MVLGFNLESWKTALQESFQNYVAQPLETKFQEVQAFNHRTQKLIAALGIGIFLLLAIAYFWPGNSKYLALIVLIGGLLLYVYKLTKENKKINSEIQNN